MKKKLLALGLGLCVLASVCVPDTFETEAATQSVLVCEKTEHIHTDSCYVVSDTLICGLEEGEGAHTHDETCYEEQSVLTCPLAEDETHTHDEGCYTVERILVCTQEETAGHFHNEHCYARELNCGLEEHKHSEECYEAVPLAIDETQQTEASEPVCSCGSEDGIHTEDCPLYIAPEKPVHIAGCSDECTAEGCTCPCHTENLKTPVKPEKPVHIDGCSDECDGTDCECDCHKSDRLFESLMACETYEELILLIEATPEEELLALTEEQVAQVEEKLLALEPEPLPEIVFEETTDEPVESEIIYPTVNFDNVAPFGEPVVG